MLETSLATTDSQSACFPGSPSFSAASLLSPGDVQAAVAKDLPGFCREVQGSWYLCGDVSDGMYERLVEQTSRDIAFRVSGIQTPVGAKYGIVSHQLGGHVHRFLLPLYEPRMGDFLLAVQKGRLAFQLGRHGSEEAVLLTPRVGLEREMLPLLALANPMPRELCKLALGELLVVVAEMGQSDRLPNLLDEAVADVSVSVVLPVQTLAQFQKRSDE